MKREVTDGPARAVHVGNATESNKRPWIAYWRDEKLTGARRVRRFSSSRAAISAAFAFAASRIGVTEYIDSSGNRIALKKDAS